MRSLRERVGAFDDRAQQHVAAGRDIDRFRSMPLNVDGVSGVLAERPVGGAKRFPNCREALVRDQLRCVAKPVIQITKWPVADRRP
jgi:hypothetical protein